MPTTTTNNDTVSTMPLITNNNYATTTIVGYALPSHKPTLSTSWPQSTCHSLAVRYHCSRRTKKFTTGPKPGISTFLTPLHNAYNFLQYSFGWQYQKFVYTFIFLTWHMICCSCLDTTSFCKKNVLFLLTLYLYPGGWHGQKLCSTQTWNPRLFKTYCSIPICLKKMRGTTVDWPIILCCGSLKTHGRCNN